MQRVIKILVAFVFWVVACQQSPQKVERGHFDNAIKEAKIDVGDYLWVVVLPGLGCHGCIQVAEAFMGEHITDRRILFVLTKVSSLKILQQKIEIRIDEYSNIYIDRDNLFQIPTNNAIYPCVVQLKDGKVFKHSFQSPQNHAFRQLENQL